MVHKLLGMGKVCYLIFFVNEGNNTASKENKTKEAAGAIYYSISGTSPRQVGVD